MASGKSSSLADTLTAKGVSRRDFLKFCAAMTAALALPMKYTDRVAAAVASAKKPVLVWLEFQDCAGNSESLLRASAPSVSEIVLDVLSLDYHETIMAAAGHQAEEALKMATAEPGSYLAVVEGSIPTKDGGVYCTVGGRTALDIAREVCGNALATITCGTCSAFGGLPAASPNPTGAVSVQEAVPGATVINLPGCPMNVANLTATVVHYLTFNALPATDQFGRPLFAYGSRIHDDCERRAHFDAGQFVREWGDEGHRAGWCLYNMGCKGPATYHNCPMVRWNDGTSWPIGAGHGCVGCSEPAFWDTMTPVYGRLPNVPGFGVEATADKIGVGVVGVVAGAFAVHGVASAVRAKKDPLPKSQAKIEEDA
ncbi:MAG: twin-arginine translocation signal domain-containing protein [Chloroflexi bacterium]|nr:MAG: twin-arginine translocation signal domain-containing protein [Chloroflexota bacterium]